MTIYLLIGGPGNGQKIGIYDQKSIEFLDRENDFRYIYKLGTYIDELGRVHNIATFDVTESQITAAIRADQN